MIFCNALDAMISGKKVTRKKWKSHQYIYIDKKLLNECIAMRIQTNSIIRYAYINDGYLKTGCYCLSHSDLFVADWELAE